MSELCKWCAYEHSDCKGNKDIPYNMHCQYYKKPAVFNAKEAAQQIQFLRGVLDQVEEDYYKVKAELDKYKGDAERCADYSEECQPNGWMPLPEPYKDGDTDD